MIKVDSKPNPNSEMPAPADVLAQHLALEPVHRALIRTIEHRLFARQVVLQTLARPVLDIGCGDGIFAALTFPDGIDVGIDVTEAIVAEARQRGVYDRVEVASGTALPFADGAFSTVVSNCVIEHIPDVEAVVREVARVLAPGGRFVFSAPNDSFTDMLPTVHTLKRWGLGKLAVQYGNWWNRHAVHYHLDAPEVWRARLAQVGLTIESQIPYMSPDAMRVMEVSHYYALPSIVWHKLFGRWSLRPGQVRSSLAYRWLRPYAEQDLPPYGACTFYVTRK